MLRCVLPLVIKSNSGGDRLVIEPDRPDYWTVTLDCSELQARHTFYEIHIDSLESDVELTATHDGRGTVALWP